MWRRNRMVGKYRRRPRRCGSRVVAAKPSAADGSGRADVEPRSAVRAAPTPTIATVGTPQAMDEYRHRLDRTQIKLYALLTALLFIGLLILLRIGQAIWIAIIAAVYIRVTLVIARREELLEEQSPAHEGNQRSAWFSARARRIVSDTKGTRAVRHDPHSGRRSTEIALRE